MKCKWRALEKLKNPEEGWLPIRFVTCARAVEGLDMWRPWDCDPVLDGNCSDKKAYAKPGDISLKLGVSVVVHIHNAQAWLTSFSQDGHGIAHVA